MLKEATIDNSWTWSLAPLLLSCISQTTKNDKISEYATTCLASIVPLDIRIIDQIWDFLDGAY